MLESHEVTAMRFFALLTIATIINIVIFEIFLRFFIFSPCSQEFDKDLGYVNIPFAQYIQSWEGFARTRFNHLGFNDYPPNLDIKKKIFIVGDSYTEAFQVNKNDAYTQIFEDGVNSLSTEKYDVIKLGRDGFSPIHYPIVVRRYITQYNPDLIILQFGHHSASDLFGDNVTANYTQKKITSLKMKVREEDKKKEKYRFIINNSSLIYYILRKYKPFLMARLDQMRQATDDHSYKNRNKPLPLHDPDKRFHLLFEEITNFKKDIIAIYLPKPGGYLKDEPTSEGVTLKALKEVTAQQNIPLIDFTPIFRNHFQYKKTVLNGFMNTLPGEGHLNSAGHKIVGTYLANFFIQQHELL